MDHSRVLREVVVDGVSVKLEEHYDNSGNYWLEIAAYTEDDEPIEQYMVEESPRLAEGWDLNCYYGEAKMEGIVWDEFFDDICEWRSQNNLPTLAEDNEPLSVEDKADAFVEQILDILTQADGASPDGECKGVIIADYTEDEFKELKPGEDWVEFCKIQALVAIRLKEIGIADRVILHPVDSVKYYRFLAENKLENNPASISYFAAVDYQKEQKNKR